MNGKTAEQYAFTGSIFLRFLGVIYLAAFFSFGSQILGLIGSDGIIPISNFLTLAKRHLSFEAYHLLPTVFWINSADLSLQLACLLGSISALLVVLGILPVLSLVFCWFLYLSLQVAGQTFMSFQWDILLLETGFLAIFLAPWKIRMKWMEDSEPHPVMIWLFRWLLFRLMFLSGVVKLASGDPSWHQLTALYFHYETQPLPTPLAWYAHQLPVALQRFSCAVMFFIELIVPFFIFIHRRTRQIAALTFASFMAVIMLTGNYCFFNWLTLGLCWMLLDDPFIKGVFKINGTPKMSGQACPRYLVFFIAGWIGFLSLVPFTRSLRLVSEWPQPVRGIATWIEPFRLVNGYGLFAVMTTRRIEISVEGSADGKQWKVYEFKYKPEDLSKAPGWAAPHQPRLDWQMWFAALSSYRQQNWFVEFCEKLLQGSPRVEKLIKNNPFPDQPPKYIRALAYQYHFTNPQDRQASKNFWKREYKGVYLPPIALKP